MLKTTTGLVLRETNYKEADKMLTVLTPDEGKLAVLARGARRKSSKIAAVSQLLAYSEMTLFYNRGRWSLNEGSTIQIFAGLRRDVVRLALGAYFAELLEAVSDADDPSPEVLRLGLNCLYALSEGIGSPQQVKAAFELRLMCLSGYAPAVDACQVCGRIQPEDPRLDLRAGLLRCAACRTEDRGLAMPLDLDALAALRWIVGAEQKKLLQFTLPPAALQQLGDLAEAYVLAQLERGFRTLDFWKTMRDLPNGTT